MGGHQYVSFEEAFFLNVNLLHSQFVDFYNNSKTCSFFLATSIIPYDTWKCMSFLFLSFILLELMILILFLGLGWIKILINSCFKFCNFDL